MGRTSREEAAQPNLPSGPIWWADTPLNRFTRIGKSHFGLFRPQGRGGGVSQPTSCFYLRTTTKSREPVQSLSLVRPDANQIRPYTRTRDARGATAGSERESERETQVLRCDREGNEISLRSRSARAGSVLQRLVADPGRRHLSRGEGCVYPVRHAADADIRLALCLC